MRNAIGSSKLSNTKLVQNSSGLFIAPLIHFCPLITGEQPQRFGGKLRIVSKRLNGSNQTVPTKQGCEPWDSCSKKRFIRDFAAKCTQIAQRASEDFIQKKTVAFDMRVFAQPL